MHLFWKKGFAATSISDLTASMQIGSPSLYAAFGSKEALYVEALQRYGELYEASVWANFAEAATAREAIQALLMDSASSLTGCRDRVKPLGCMVTLSAAGSEGNECLGEIVRTARAQALQRVLERLGRAVAEGEVSASVDIAAVSRFVIIVQNGMSLQARDGATRRELEAVAQAALAGWNSLVEA